MPRLYDCDVCGYWYDRKASCYICPQCMWPAATCCDGAPCAVITEKEESYDSQEAQQPTGLRKAV